MSIMAPPPRSYTIRMSLSLTKKPGTPRETSIFVSVPSSPLSMIAFMRRVAGWNLPSVSADPRNEEIPRCLPIVECLHKDEAFFLSECEHLACFFGSISTWFFEEDVFSSRKRFHSPFVMQSIWQLCREPQSHIHNWATRNVPGCTRRRSQGRPTVL